MHVQHITGNGPGLGAWGVLHVVGIPFLLLLDQPAVESGPVKGFFILRARRFGAGGFLGVFCRVVVWWPTSPCWQPMSTAC